MGACGGEDEAALSLEAVASETEAAGSFRFRLTNGIAYRGEVRSPIVAEGAIDLVRERGYLDSEQLAAMRWFGETVYNQSDGEDWTRSTVPAECRWSEMMNPTGTLDRLREAADARGRDVAPETVGTETWDGVEVTHLRLDLSDERHRETVDVWVDHEQRARKLVHASGRAQSPSTTTLTNEFWDFGVTVDVSKPPDAQVDGPHGTVNC
jgi:hypothetical protein